MNVLNEQSRIHSSDAGFMPFRKEMELAEKNSARVTAVDMPFDCHGGFIQKALSEYDSQDDLPCLRFYIWRQPNNYRCYIYTNTKQDRSWTKEIIDSDTIDEITARLKPVLNGFYATEIDEYFEQLYVTTLDIGLRRLVIHGLKILTRSRSRGDVSIYHLFSGWYVLVDNDSFKIYKTITEMLNDERHIKEVRRILFSSEWCEPAIPTILR